VSKHSLKYKIPEGYMTPDTFRELFLRAMTLSDYMYFKDSTVKHHPDDISIHYQMSLEVFAVTLTAIYEAGLLKSDREV